MSFIWFSMHHRCIIIVLIIYLTILFVRVFRVVMHRTCKFRKWFSLIKCKTTENMKKAKHLNGNNIWWEQCHHSDWLAFHFFLLCSFFTKKKGYFWWWNFSGYKGKKKTCLKLLTIQKATEFMPLNIIHIVAFHKCCICFWNAFDVRLLLKPLWHTQTHTQTHQQTRLHDVQIYILPSMVHWMRKWRFCANNMLIDCI